MQTTADSSVPRDPQAHAAPRVHRISASVSVGIDALRISLAMVVVVGHYSQRYFQERLPDLTNVAIGAVGGFFVLSGFTISVLSESTRKFTAQRYFAERLSRLWSVALPALLLTVACDAAARLIAPSYYEANWAIDASTPVLRLFVNSLFLSQLWGADFSPLSNSPFWSLSYEMGFYVLYGVWCAFGPRVRPAAVLGVALLLGPNIVFMLPFWLLGVLVHRAYLRMSLRLCGLTCVATALGGACLGGAALLLHVQPRTGLGWVASAIRGYFGFFGVSNARVRPLLVVSGVGFAFLFLFLITLAKANETYHFAALEPYVSRARKLGELTFPLYLFHFPLLVLASATDLYDRRSLAHGLLLLTALCVLIWMLTPVTVWCKRVLRAQLGRWLPDRLEEPARLLLQASACQPAAPTEAGGMEQVTADKDRS